MAKRYTVKEKQKLASAVLEIMESGIPCGQACKKAGVPKATFLGWKNGDKELLDQYAYAREAMIDAMAEEIIEIADTTKEGHKTKIDANGDIETTVEDMLGHRRLQIDARKWLLSKVAPKKYGDRIQLAGDEDAPLKVETITRKIVKPDAS